MNLVRRITLLTVIFAWVLPLGLTGCGSSAASSNSGAGSGAGTGSGGGSGTGTGNGTGGTTGSGTGGSSGSGGSGTGSGSGDSSSAAPLSASDVNLIFVVSEDLNYQASGDINPTTANLTDQGLQRSLLMANFLHTQVLGSKNVTGIYALEPMTHLQTSENDPDLVALWTIEQFALLNQFTLSSVTGSYASPYTANSYPINASYASGSVPSGVAAPAPSCPSCQGIDFNDQGGDNESLVSAIVKANAPGFYVFSAPWETVSSLLTKMNNLEGYNLSLPATYQGPNYIYAISIPPSGSAASLVTYSSNALPSSTYPALPAPVPTTSSCTEQTPFSITVTGRSDGATVPSETNTNETIYFIRHAEDHPQGSWDDGNYLGAGQWRALDLPAALKGKISPSQVYSIDPSQVILGAHNAAGNSYWSYVRAPLTAEPYAIANNLPYNLAAGFEALYSNGPESAADFFFQGGTFSNQKVLVAWEHLNIVDIVNALIANYFPSGDAPVAPAWPGVDYDTIWTVTLDGHGNLTVNNANCEGINSSALPATAPQF